MNQHIFLLDAFSHKNIKYVYYLEAGECLRIYFGDPVLGQVECLQLLGVDKRVGWQGLKLVVPQVQELHLPEAVEGLVGHGPDLVGVELERDQAVLVAERLVLDRHDLVVAKVHRVQVGQKPERTKTIFN